jgi:hypothetical protein
MAAREISVKQYVVRLSAMSASSLKRDPEGKEFGATAAEGPDLVESRCLGSR